MERIEVRETGQSATLFRSGDRDLSKPARCIWSAASADTRFRAQPATTYAGRSPRAGFLHALLTRTVADDHTERTDGRRPDHARSRQHRAQGSRRSGLDVGKARLPKTRKTWRELYIGLDAVSGRLPHPARPPNMSAIPARCLIFWPGIQTWCAASSATVSMTAYRPPRPSGRHAGQMSN